MKDYGPAPEPAATAQLSEAAIAETPAGGDDLPGAPHDADVAAASTWRTPGC